MNTTLTPDRATSTPHWIDILDCQGQCPPWRLGPFADAREAQRIERGVRRLINLARFAVVVTPPRAVGSLGAPPSGGVPRVSASKALQGALPASGESGAKAPGAGLAGGLGALAGQAPPALKLRQPQPSHFSSDTASHSAQASISAR
jgi:hypothetical protein